MKLENIVIRGIYRRKEVAVEFVKLCGEWYGEISINRRSVRSVQLEKSLRPCQSVAADLIRKEFGHELQRRRAKPQTVLKLVAEDGETKIVTKGEPPNARRTD